MLTNKRWVLPLVLALLQGCMGAAASQRLELTGTRETGTVIALGKACPRPKPNPPTTQQQPPPASQPTAPAKPVVSQPAYQLGASDGGPGTWVQSPKRSAGVEHQKKITGAPEGVEYAVPASTKSGKILFDGYRDGKLIDAKDWKTWPPANKEFWKKSVLEEAREQVKAARGTPVEWHISTKDKAGLVRALLRENGVQGLSVKGPQ